MNKANITYIGEHLWAGNLGNFFLILLFVGALVSSVVYYFSFKQPEEHSWLKLARLAFRIHSIAILGIVALMLFMLFNHYYEYQYVWQHSSNSMDMKYILSCLWEGQEGSFILWAFWHVVIGTILIRSAGKYEAPVMMIISLVQVFLASMLLGIYIGGLKIGSNPFLLLREHPEFMNLPFVSFADYLSKLDGRGLNPLLQNYWMVIHPPTLFLGFALTIVPFAYALSGALKSEFNSWQKAALPWTYAGVTILGTGILMGGAWAYEALSFGGFWAWDPVENASLVPWITLVGAGHVMIINKNKGSYLFATYLLCVVTFILVLYSTFLTRSGILGDSSVHAFTDLGMQKQLLLFLLGFCYLSVHAVLQRKIWNLAYLAFSMLCLGPVFLADLYPSLLLLIWCSASLILFFASYYFNLRSSKTEDDLFSREFWTFIGTMVLFLTAVVISLFTSIPIFNKLLHIKGAPFDINKYNQWTIPFAIIILVLMAFGQFLKYKKTDKKKFLKQISFSFLLALVIGGTCAAALYAFKAYDIAPASQKKFYIAYALLLIAAFFGLFANTDYWLRLLKGKIKSAGASIAHIGFSLLLMGALVSTSKKITLSKNSSRFNVEALGKEYNGQKSILLTEGDTLAMGAYYVSYKGKEQVGINILYHVEYFKKVNNKYEKQFSLYPRVQLNDRMGNAAEPDTKHFADKDIYTHVTYANLSTMKPEGKADTYLEPSNFVIHTGDSLSASNCLLLLDSLKTDLSEEEYSKNDSLLTVTAVIRATDINGKTYKAYPKYVLRKDIVEPKEDSIKALGLKFIFWKINPEQGSVEISVSEKKSNKKDFIVMEAYLFPFINVLWTGCMLMVIGTGIAVMYRIKDLRRKNAIS